MTVTEKRRVEAGGVKARDEVFKPVGARVFVAGRRREQDLVGSVIV